MRLPAICLLLTTLVLLAGCGPFGEDEPAAVNPTPTATSANPATLPPMRIVTRTPVDPAQIAPTSAETPGQIEVPATYVVQEGDTLYSIANLYQLDLAEIVALNGLSDPNDISVGQELMLPVPAEG